MRELIAEQPHDAPGPVVAVADWMRAAPGQIAPFVSGELRWRTGPSVKPHRHRHAATSSGRGQPI